MTASWDVIQSRSDPENMSSAQADARHVVQSTRTPSPCEWPESALFSLSGRRNGGGADFDATVAQSAQSQSRFASIAWASIADSNAMNSVHGVALTHVARCASLAGP